MLLLFIKFRFARDKCYFRRKANTLLSRMSFSSFFLFFPPFHSFYKLSHLSSITQDLRNGLQEAEVLGGEADDGRNRMSSLLDG